MQVWNRNVLLDVVCVCEKGSWNKGIFIHYRWKIKYMNLTKK